MPDYFGEPTPTEQRYYDAIGNGECCCGMKDRLGRARSWVPLYEPLDIDLDCPVHGHLCPVRPQETS